MGEGSAKGDYGMAGAARFQPSLEDYVSASRSNFLCQLRSGATWRRIAITYLVIALLAAMAAGLIFGDWPIALLAVPLGSAAGLLALPVCWGLAYLMMPRRCARLFAQQRTLHQLQEIGWDDSALRWQSPTTSLMMPWRDYHRWHETSKEFLLFLNEGLPQFIPHHAFEPEDAADLRKTLVEHGPPRR